MRQIKLLLLTAIVAASCSKTKDTVIPAPTPAPVDDARTVLLKDIVAQNLPNPYYRFVYNDQRYVTQIQYADGQAVYNVEYENKRVKKLTNTVNGRILLYSYSNGNVTEVNEFEAATAKKLFRYILSYNANKQLTELKRFEFGNNETANLIAKAVFTYFANGNVKTIDNYTTSNGQLQLGSRHEFGSYDQGICVDDFSFPDDMLDSFLFLPQVKLMKNNPGTYTISGDVASFLIEYSYEYVNELPVKKSGVMTQTSGPGIPQVFRFTNQFTYY